MKVKGWVLKSAHEGQKVLLHQAAICLSLPVSGHMISHPYLSMGICFLLSVSSLLPCSIHAWYVMVALISCDLLAEDPH